MLRTGWCTDVGEQKIPWNRAAELILGLLTVCAVVFFKCFKCFKSSASAHDSQVEEHVPAQTTGYTQFIDQPGNAAL